MTSLKQPNWHFDMIKFISRFLRWLKGGESNLSYWEKRAEQWGRRAVLHLGHAPEAYESVTDNQKAILLPELRARLIGTEQTILDLGCGPGRFTPDLAKLTGHAIGVDPITSFLDLAPSGPGIEYMEMVDNRIPIPPDSVDVVWLCLVLGGLVRPEDLQIMVDEIDRVLTSSGLLFLVENTHSKPNEDHWVYRSVEEYKALFPSHALAEVLEYQDLGERISVLAGRPQSDAEEK